MTETNRPFSPTHALMSNVGRRSKTIDAHAPALRGSRHGHHKGVHMESQDRPVTLNPDPELRKLELELEREKILVDFAKFGFRGTLAAGVLGISTILLLAALKAFAKLDISDWGLVAIAVVFLTGAVAFGFFSLWQLPNIVARLGKTELSVKSDSVSDA
ncbi:hypothetical protein QTH97_35450 [Variovorax sp. J22R24]|uniref:hypothetical protein n=1 Tax=Variovorax gracilis TaxID=3053502 RepID=UPI0025758125|nr:hypothetical protein [Variovorax sp. J22R24]MDM0110232.1 hypothetical protein [Variovorax sp. J22R24]